MATRNSQITITSGQTKVLRATVYDSQGYTVNLNGADVVFSIAKKRGDTPVFSKDTSNGVTIEDAAEGVVKVKMETNDTKLLSRGEYVYDLWVVFGSGDAVERYPVASGTVKVESPVTVF